MDDDAIMADAAPLSTGSEIVGGAPSSAAAPTDKRHPHRARVLANRRLTADGCGRDVRHIEVDVTGWGLQYAPGDALAVHPANPEAPTRALLASLGLQAHSELHQCTRQEPIRVVY